MWCVTHFTKNKMKAGERVQHQEWFSAEEEGNKFMEENKDE